MRKALFFIMFLGATTAFAQIQMPPPSPTFTVAGTVGLADVSVTYSRPSANGRTIFGDLVPYGEIWRTGANASTKIKFSEDVMLEGNAVPAGEYGLYTIPGKETWTFILSKNLTWWGAVGYDQSEDLLRFDVPAKEVSSHYETFTISFSDFTMNSAYLNLKWEKSKAKFKIENEVESKIMAQIKAQVIDATPADKGVYYQAASYYFNTDKDLNQALDFINKGIVKGEEKYWQVHLQAKILAKLGKNKEAEKAAQQSIELAKTAGNMDYVRLNEKLIAEM